MIAPLTPTIALVSPQSVTFYWYVARGSGFVLYILLTLSIVLGLLMAMHWRTDTWPRIITEELHRYILLVAAVFLVVHIGSTLLDSFIHFSLSQVLVPFTSTYRTIWMSAGIVAMYLAIALFSSFYLRRYIGYKLWRTMHYAGSTAWFLALVHSVTTGTDTRSAWALAIYGGSVLIVAILLAVRLGGLPMGVKVQSSPETGYALVTIPSPVPLRPRVLWTIAGVLVLGTILVKAGPLTPGWAARAGGAPATTQPAIQTVSLPPDSFSDSLSGTSNQQTPSSLQPGTVLLHLKVQGSGSYPVTLTYGLLLIPGAGGAQFVRGVFALAPTSLAWSCSGAVTFQPPNTLDSNCSPPGSSTPLQLATQFNLDGTGNVIGQLQATPAGGGASNGA